MTKKLVNPVSVGELSINYPVEDQRTPDWRFRVDEVSPGHYVVEGCDIWGRRCSLEGSDPDALLSECIEYARSH